MPPILYAQLVGVLILIGVYKLVVRLVEDWIEHRRHQRTLAAAVHAANIHYLETTGATLTDAVTRKP